MPTATPLRVYQAGVESTNGTPVAATAKLAVETMEFEELDNIMRPRLAKGLMVQNPGNEFATMRGTRWSRSGPIDYEQLPFWLGMAVAGGVTASAGPPYTWVYARSLTADPGLDAATFERRITDGVTPIDHEFSYALAERITISGNRAGELRLEAEGFARRRQNSTLTAALTMPTPEHIPHTLSTWFIDTSWAGVGVTQVSGQVLDWSITFVTGAVPWMTADGRTDLDFNTALINGELVTVTAEITALLGGQYATELAAAEAGTLRAVQMKSLGSSSRDLEIDFLAKHEAGSIVRLDTIDGQDVVRFRFAGSTDGTNLFRATLINQSSGILGV